MATAASVAGIPLMLLGCVLVTSGCLHDEDVCGDAYHSTEMKLDEDQNYNLDLGSRVSRLDYDFKRYDDENHDIDIYTLDEMNYQQYRNGGSFVYIDSLSNPATNSKSFSKGPVSLEEDQYYFIIDNSDRGDSAPPSDGVNNVVHFDVDVNIYKCNE